MIEVKNLCRRYADRVALDYVSFTVADGGVHGILGARDAGKSTLMHILAGADTAFSGSVQVGKNNVATDAVAVRRSVGYLPQNPPLYRNMTPFEHLVFVGEAKGVPQEKLYRQIKSAMELTGLEEYSDRPVHRLTAAQCKRVGIAMTLLGNPELILLDEPLTGVNPEQAKELRALIRKLGSVKAVIVCSRSLTELRELAEDVLILAGGAVVAHGTPEALEEKLAVSTALQICVAGKEDEILSLLSQVDGLTDCTVLLIEETGYVTLKLEYEEGKDVEQAVTAKLNGASHPVRSLSYVPLTLEDVYRKLCAEADDAHQKAMLEEAEQKSAPKKRKSNPKNAKKMRKEYLR